ncbi:hypothetical protein TW85_13115 [Marinomonas sp. S3726]|nr:hypothetical protein TW85_13115 [Marinomonas sp. S3726]
MLSGYCLAYLFYTVVMAVIANNLLVFYVMLLAFVFSPFIVIPLSIINLILGYPIFKLFLSKLAFPKVISLVISFGVSSSLCAFLYEVGRAPSSGKGVVDSIGEVSITLVLGCLLAAIFSSLVYWYIEREAVE